MSELSLKNERQSDYARQIERISEEKRRIYERFVLDEITADEYKASKASLDEKLSRLTQIYTALSRETSKLEAAKSAGAEAKKIAVDISGEKTLTRPLADLLVERILVYPGDKIEVEWKIKNFFTDCNIQKTR